MAQETLLVIEVKAVNPAWRDWLAKQSELYVEWLPDDIVLIGAPLETLSHKLDEVLDGAFRAVERAVYGRLMYYAIQIMPERFSERYGSLFDRDYGIMISASTKMRGVINVDKKRNGTSLPPQTLFPDERTGGNPSRT